METQYSNQNAYTDLAELHMDPIDDNSGLKLYYTPAIRKYDAGVLSVGEYLK